MEFNVLISNVEESSKNIDLAPVGDDFLNLISSSQLCTDTSVVKIFRKLSDQ